MQQLVELCIFVVIIEDYAICYIVHIVEYSSKFYSLMVISAEIRCLYVAEEFHGG